MRTFMLSFVAVSAALAAACSGNPEASTSQVAKGGAPAPAAGQDEPMPTLRADVQPVTRASDAQAGVFVPPFLDCRAPVAGDPPGEDAGKVCTHVSISGCTEQGRYFPNYASCEIVRTQRPYWPEPPHATPPADDPRLSDAAYMKELAWVTEQARASACTCCHDGTQAPKGASQWDIAAGRLWTDTASDAALALFSGLADSSIFGAYPPADNHGFERTFTGIPSTDGPRMRAFWIAELKRRGITEAQAAATPPFGGFLLDALHKAPTACKPGVGVDASGVVRWGDRKVRYVDVLEASAPNPGFAPSTVSPEGVLWRLDVLPSADALAGSVRYGATPKGTFQDTPATGRAPRLVHGRSYHLAAYVDVGVAAENCTFTYDGP